jgi:hypothetical protein
MSQANAPVLVADIPLSEKPTALQANSTASQATTTSPQANTTSTPANTTAPRSSAATPPVVVSYGTVTAPKPAQSLTPTYPVPQVAVIPASSNGTASIPVHEHWRVGLCDADDMETCVRCILQASPSTRAMLRANTSPSAPLGVYHSASPAESRTVSTIFLSRIPTFRNATPRVVSLSVSMAA